ncbi:MAG TPA: alpha/beta hydrolase [Polyangiaceae bacterium]|nr:alpha/beta hydrolase [Polyangiaceae bacterium]
MTDERLPIAYLPGASGRGSVFRAVAERLGRRRPSLLVDYPGLSDVPLDPSIESLSDLTTWVANQIPDRVDVVSLSAGCAVALRLALAFPAAVRRLVLVTAASGVDARRFGGVDFRPGFLKRRPKAPRWFLDDDVDLTDRLGDVKAPTLLVFGERDLVAPPAVGEHLARHLPSARLEVLPGGTHDLEAEFPDELAALVERHLRG